MTTPYAGQLADKAARAQEDLASVVSASVWTAPWASPESGFRNKAKLAVGGAPGQVTLGILDAGLRGVDLRSCGLHEAPLRQAIPVLAAFVDDLRLLPYDVRKARGELKYVHATVNTDGELMVRLVLRSERQLARVRAASAELRRALPGLRVLSANLQPEHKAVLEGDTEIVMTAQDVLPMRLPSVTLALRPGSFFQTNTAVAAGLYAQAVDWVADLAPTTVWDLHCGVGGFALHLAGPGREVTGVEISPAAITSAREASGQHHNDVTFVIGDATAFATSSPTAPDLVVVNPPRRGIGPELAAWLEGSSVRHVLYSSCHPRTLATDLAAMPSFAAARARLFDMFPQTHHAEVLVLLTRR